MAARTKTADQLAGHRNRVELRIVASGDLEAPPLPDGIETPEARQHWTSIWASEVSLYWEPASDLGGLVRYILTFDAWIKARAIATAIPMVRGSQGQLRPNPIESTVQRLAHELRSFETRYGLTPRDRVGLGIGISAGDDADERTKHELPFVDTADGTASEPHPDPETVSS